MKINLENNVDIFEKCPRIRKIVENKDGTSRLCYFIDLWEHARNKRNTVCKNPSGVCKKGTCVKIGNSSMEFVGCKFLDKNYNFIVDYEVNGVK
jgi:hypothetical protein